MNEHAVESGGAKDYDPNGTSMVNLGGKGAGKEEVSERRKR